MPKHLTDSDVDWLLGHIKPDAFAKKYQDKVLTKCNEIQNRHRTNKEDNQPIMNKKRLEHAFVAVQCAVRDNAEDDKVEVLALDYGKAFDITKEEIDQVLDMSCREISDKLREQRKD